MQKGRPIMASLLFAAKNLLTNYFCTNSFCVTDCVPLLTRR